MPRLVLLLGAALAALLAVPAPVSAGEGREPYSEISVAEVARLLGQPGFKVYDANSPRTYARRHLPGAVNVDYEDLTVGELPADKATRVVFYCANEH